MSRPPYATFREDLSDALGELDTFARVLDDSKCYLRLAQRGLEYATGTGHECVALAAEVDALIAKTKDAARKIRAATREAAA